MSCALTCITWVHGISVLLGYVSTKFTWVARVAWVTKYFYEDKFFLRVSIFVFVGPTILHESILVTWIFFFQFFTFFSFLRTCFLHLSFTFTYLRLCTFFLKKNLHCTRIDFIFICTRIHFISICPFFWYDGH